MKTRLLLSLLAALVFSSGAHARSFREMNPIGQPEPLGAHQTRPTTVRAVSQDRVRQAMDGIAQAWSGGNISRFLDANFANGNRLADTVREVVPRDARLRIISVRSAATLDQRMESPPGQAAKRISTVSALVESQIEFNDPTRGFQTLKGTNEYILRFVETD